MNNHDLEKAASVPLYRLYQLWDKLTNVPTTHEGDLVDCIEEPFLHFPIDTHREEIWAWFEQMNSGFVVGEVMSGIRQEAMQPNACPEAAFVSTLERRLAEGDANVVNAIKTDLYASHPHPAGETDSAYLRRCLKADYAAGINGKAVFQLHYDLIHGSDLDGPLASILSDLEHSGLCTKDFPTYAEFKDWWEELNHYEVQDAELGESEALAAESHLEMAYQALSKPFLSFEMVIARYRTLLEQNPGKALDLGITTHFAVMDSAGYVYGVLADNENAINYDDAFDFDSSAFSENGGWDGEPQEATLLSLVSPRFVDLPSPALNQAKSSTLRMG